MVGFPSMRTVQVPQAPSLQPSFTLVRCSVSRRQRRSFWFRSTVTVSYTHLDGYKRQHSVTAPAELNSMARFFSGTAEIRMLPSVPMTSVSTW